MIVWVQEWGKSMMRFLFIVGGCALLFGCQPMASTAEEPVKKTQFGETRVEPTKPTATTEVKPVVPFDGVRAIKYAKSLCDIGPRISGTDGMKKQQELLVKHFEDLGGKVSKQEFLAEQKSQKNKVAMTNLIVKFHPDRKDRVLFCAHYDTRPQADQEDNRKNWSLPFVSANDGTSGVAWMMELAHHLKDFPTKVGVDLVIFDGEEYVFSGPSGDDLYFLGSRHFATAYREAGVKRGYIYRAGILLDLFAHDGAKLKVESYSYAAAKDLVGEVWGIAGDLKAKSFKFERGYKRSPEGYVQDDHVPLIDVGIPVIDVIDFDYEHWHKASDTVEKLSAKQMNEVALVLTTWLMKQK